ncbi:MAG: hypothetical protein P8M25_06170, partial [Paracoccaceae bacterium]|nr:hypothetical protein [Paracoccaceae bacterium]
IGGCCGTMSKHLQKMRAALDSQPKRQIPTLDQITDRIGPFSSLNDGTGETANTPPRRRSKRTSKTAVKKKCLNVINP